MAVEVKWIKIVIDIFDDEKIRLIEDMPDADSILVIWFKLLCLAGKSNQSGLIMLNDKIAYTDEMLSVLFRRPLNTVRLALSTFERFGMVEIIDNIITVSNWEKHQNKEKLQSMREYNRLAKQKEREKKKQLLCQGHVNDSQYIEEDIDKDIDIDKDKDIENKTGVKTPYATIVNLYNEICIDFSKIERLSDARKKAIKARFATYTVEDFKTLFEKAQASKFLKGGNDRNWKANFDWLIKDANMAKVLDGNYDERNSNGNGTNDPARDIEKSELNVTRF